MERKSHPFFYPLFAYESARSALLGTEFSVLNGMQNLLPGSGKYRTKLEEKTIKAIRHGLNELFKKDSQNILEGVYPLTVLRPESPLKHIARIPSLLADGVRLYRQRNQGRTAVFTDQAKEYLSDVPRYYQRNFHFQSDGYLSQHSARLYEHQVEMLFAGSADAMRRLIIAPLREKFGHTDGQGLNFLEIGVGTGRATRFVQLAFPKAKIIAVDLSAPYLKQAEQNLTEFPRVSFVQADGARLPFQDEYFDAAYSVFLYHELPFEERKAVITESLRVLKKSGFLGLVDSLQEGDSLEFGPLLKTFPHNYHEPFYRNYTEHSMQDLLKECGLKSIKHDQGFYSKVCWGHKRK